MVTRTGRELVLEALKGLGGEASTQTIAIHIRSQRGMSARQVAQMLRISARADLVGRGRWRLRAG